MMVASAKNNQIITLADGRTLGFAEFGDCRGAPVFYFHGFPGSRLEAGLGDGAACRQGVRLIAVDRPGYGRSTPCPGRRLRDWPPDVAALADALGIARFGVLGVSGGGPFALACAAGLPERIDGLALVCPLGPLGDPALYPLLPRSMRILLTGGRRFPTPTRWLGRRLLNMVRRRPERALKLLLSQSPQRDRQLLRQPEIFATLAASAREAFARQGLGAVGDLAIYAAAWEFAPGEITRPLVLWHGADDHSVPRSLVNYLVEHLPGCVLRLVDGEGHFSLPINHMDEILAELRR